MANYSHSKIGSFDTCPLQYKYAYIDRVKVEAEDTIETFLGSRVHDVLEKLYRDLMYEKRMSLEELLVFYDELWKKTWKDSIIIVKKDYTQDNYFKMGERYLGNYYERHDPFDKGRIIGLETQNFLSLDEEGRYKFHVRIDRLMDMGQGLYEVHDYKTGMKLPTQGDLDKDRQLAMYSLWVRRRFKDFKKARLVWHYLAYDKEMDSYRTEAQLESLREDVLSKIDEIEQAEEFLPQASSLCDWCLYRGICPQWKHKVQLEEKPANEYLNDPGVKLVDEYVKAKAEFDEFKKGTEEKLEKIKEALIGFSKSEGISVVVGSENKISVREQESVKFPAKNTIEREELIGALREIGKLDEVSDLDYYALTRILKSKDWEENELEMLRKFEKREKYYKLSVGKK